ncbi:SCO family protein [Ideonella sp.]|uniref:SCO family protein n=1 Tax=Ideonella sp. TaxID=1929293 RepID=UPI003BB66501
MPMKRRTLLFSSLAPLALVATLAACSPAGPASFKGIDITGAEYAKELKLADVDGRERSLADFKGKVVVVFFGYVQCPDVCPTTLTELAAIKQQLGAQGKDVQSVFVTVDPERDTAEVLKAYMANFGPDFVALRGTPEQTQAAAKAFKVFYAKVPGKTESSYTVDHTAGSYLFDKAGRVRVFSRYGSGAEALTQDLKTLLAEPV